MSTKLTKEQNDFVTKFKNHMLNTPGIKESIKGEIDNYKEKEFTEINSNTVKILKDFIDENPFFDDEEKKKMISNVNVNQIIVAFIFNLLSLQCRSIFNKIRKSNNCRKYFDELSLDTQNKIISHMKEYTEKIYFNRSE